MSAANLFGQIISPKAVEHAMAASLNLWLDTYLGELERVEGYAPGAIERPRGIIPSSEFAKWPEDQIPVVVVINLGLAQKPERRHDGIYDASWLIGVAVIVSDVDRAATRDLAFTYTAAVRAAVLQHKLLQSDAYPDGFAKYTVWHDETYGDLAFNETRTLGAGRTIFEVGVPSAVTEYAGPRAPADDPTVDPGPRPTVTQTEISVVPIGIEESV